MKQMEQTDVAPLIVLVEDEEHLAQGLLFNLQAEGYRVHLETDGDSALAYLLAHTASTFASDQSPPGQGSDIPQSAQPSAVLLDCMLPGTDGFTIVRTMRERQRYTPVLLLTARSRPEDVLEGIEAGADDYLAKPFDLNILLVRLKSLLRRMTWQISPHTVAAQYPPAPRDEYHFAGRSIRFDTLELHAFGRSTQLTLMEAELLRYLTDREGRIIPRKEILERVWRVHEDTDTRAVDNFVVRLRRYIEVDPARPRHLLTVRGVGYRFVPEA